MCDDAGFHLPQSFSSKCVDRAASVFAPRIALDLGTATTLIYVDGRGLALKEPSIVRVRASTGEIEAAGADAEAGFGRTPTKLRTLKPVRGGTIQDLTLCEGMLQRFLRKAKVSGVLRHLRVAAAIPDNLTDVERMAIIESLHNARAGDVFLVEQTLAAAQGAGLDVGEPHGHMVVDSGAGVTGVALISMGATVQSRSVPVAGDDMDASIVSYVRRKYQILIGERTAERAKIEIGSAMTGSGNKSASVTGRCLVRGVPRSVSLCEGEIQEALAEPVRHIESAIREVLEQAPPELSADLLDTGIVLTGGSALLRNLDRHISEEFGLPVRVAEAPLTSVVLGVGSQLEYLTGRGRDRFRFVP